MSLRCLLVALILLSTASVSIAMPLSSINLTIESTAADLAAIINQSLPQELYKGQGGLGASVKVLRGGPVVVTADDNFVFFTLPVQVTVGYGLYESLPLRAGLRFKARAQVSPDWRLKTELYVVGPADGLPDSLRLGPLTLKPRSLLEGSTLAVQRLLAPIIDAKVNDLVKLQPKVQAFWQQAGAPILVNREFSTWLQLRPERIVISPLRADMNRISLTVGVVSGAEVTVGPQPAVQPVRPLPPAQELILRDRGFHLQLHTDLFFSDLVTVLTPVLQDKTFGDAKKVTVKKFSLKGEGERLVVTLTTSGDFEGDLTVLARPVHTAKTNRLTFEDVDFDTRNAGWLISAGSWLFSSSIRSTIKEKLDGAVVEQLEKARLKASASLASLQLAERARLTGTVTALTLGETAVLPDRLSVQVITEGEVSAVFK